MGSIKKITCLCIAVMITSVVYALICGVQTLQTQKNQSGPVLVVDPGHGGMDGGAVSYDGVSEKDINLAIAHYLRKAAQKEGWQVIMTRQDDRWLSTDSRGSIRSRKTEDLQNRRKIISGSGADVAVSIHLNSFREDPSVKGIQVFYPDTGNCDAAGFAETMQESINEYMAVEKERTAMVREGVMIFKEITCPTVIVECGFLSNRDEAAMLQKPEYQKRLAEAVMTGIRNFSGYKRPENVEIIDSLR